MIHSFIAPIQYLEHIPVSHYGPKVHLVLAHLLDNQIYCDYYKNRQKQGDLIIMDNGAFEFHKPLLGEQLANICDLAQFQPDVIVAPDYPFEHHSKTIESAYQFSRTLKHNFASNVSIMVVPQSLKGDCNGWMEAYHQMSRIDNVTFIGMSILGIPNAFQAMTGTKDVSFNRTFATQFLLNYGFSDKKHHYLGCDSPREIAMMKAQQLAYSNDSSTAFWHGILGEQFDHSVSGLIGGKVNIPVDFNVGFDKSKLLSILHNIQWIGNLLEIDYYPPQSPLIS